MESEREQRVSDLTYSRINIEDWLLDDNLPPSTSTSTSTPTSLPCKFDLGLLDILPLEILQRVLVQLDLNTFTEFLLVNRRAQAVIRSVPEYRAIFEHAFNALRGIACIKTGRWITCEILYEKLCTEQCATCGDFGGYLYLIVCERVCFLCLSEHLDYLPLRYSHASAKFGLSRSILRGLPQLRSLPGIYTPRAIKVRDSLTLIDHKSVSNAADTLKRKPDTTEAVSVTAALQSLPKNDQSAIGPVRGHEGSNVQRRQRRDRTDYFDGQSSNPLRFMAAIPCPWLDRDSHNVTWGFHCRGCEEAGEWPQDFRRKFTSASFDAHLAAEGIIRDGVHCID